MRKVKEQQKEFKSFLGDEYRDYGLVVAQPDGRPCEASFIRKRFNRMIAENDLKGVVFHSLRHSSTSLKLRLSQGNIKAVQGDTGHSQAKMVTDVYAHIFDSDRKLIAKEMQDSFFSRIGEENEKTSVEGFDMAEAITFLQENPELWKELQQRINDNKK